MEQQRRQAQRVDDPGDAFFDWATTLTGLLSPEQISGLELGQRKWGDLLPSVQSLAILRIAETIHAKLGDLSQSLYNRHKPGWASSVASWTKTAGMDWQVVLKRLGVHPSSLPISARIGRSGSSG